MSKCILHQPKVPDNTRLLQFEVKILVGFYITYKVFIVCSATEESVNCEVAVADAHLADASPAKEGKPRAAKRLRVSQNKTGTGPRQLEETSTGKCAALIIKLLILFRFFKCTSIIIENGASVHSSTDKDSIEGSDPDVERSSATVNGIPKSSEKGNKYHCRLCDLHYKRKNGGHKKICPVQLETKELLSKSLHYLYTKIY